MHCPKADESSRSRAVAQSTVGAEWIRARRLSVALSVFALGFLTLAPLLLSLHFLSYVKAKEFFDACVALHSAQGGAASYLTREAHDRLFERLPAVACLFGICGVTLALFKHKLARFLLDTPSEWAGIWNSVRLQFSAGTETVLEIGAVFIVFGIGVFLRLWYLGRPVRYDEAWTYVDFASRPLVHGLSIYPPNNHLFNTLLIHFSTNLFGNTLFGLRFPALAAGCLVILGAWFVTRARFGPSAGILAAGGVAVLPTFIEFSVNARGYALQWLSILGCMWFAVVLQETPSLRTAWMGLVLAAVAGIYSIPTTVLAVAGIFGWMLASTLADGKAAQLNDLMRRLALAGLAIGLLSMLLYVPPLLVSGPAALTAQSVVAWQQQANFDEGLKRMGRCAWVYWTEGVPTGVLWILFAGFIVALLASHKMRKHRVSMTLAICLVAVIFGWTRHIFGFPRVWSYLLLSAVMTASAGVSLALKYLSGPSSVRRIVFAGAASAVLAVLSAIGLLKQGVLLTTNETGTIIDADQIVYFLSTELRPGDHLVGNAIIDYELLRLHPRLYGLLSSSQDAARVVAVVTKDAGGTESCRTTEVIARMAEQDSATPTVLADRIDLSAYTQPQISAKFLTSTVYSLERRQQAQ
jgi:Dolichyl-phosphate-mannose-protein mannosyltransferase